MGARRAVRSGPCAARIAPPLCLCPACEVGKGPLSSAPACASTKFKKGGGTRQGSTAEGAGEGAGGAGGRGAPGAPGARRGALGPAPGPGGPRAGGTRVVQAAPPRSGRLQQQPRGEEPGGLEAPGAGGGAPASRCPAALPEPPAPSAPAAATRGGSTAVPREGLGLSNFELLSLVQLKPAPHGRRRRRGGPRADAGAAGVRAAASKGVGQGRAAAGGGAAPWA